MKRIIGVDIDGVLADFNTSFIDLFVDVTGRDLFPARPFDIPVWDYPQYYGYTDEENKKVWAVIKDSETFWETLDPYDGIEKAANFLFQREQAGDDIYFVTSRPGASAKRQTEWWLQDYTPLTPTVLITGRKGLASLTLDFTDYIDDRWENCVDVARTRKTNVFLMNRPWNYEYSSHLPILRTNFVEEMMPSVEEAATAVRG